MVSRYSRCSRYIVAILAATLILTVIPRNAKSDDPSSVLFYDRPILTRENAPLCVTKDALLKFFDGFRLEMEPMQFFNLLINSGCVAAADGWTVTIIESDQSAILIDKIVWHRPDGSSGTFWTTQRMLRN
jgi:hypothetical protein